MFDGIISGTKEQITTLAELRDVDRTNRQASIADSTKRTYVGDFRRFRDWAEAHGRAFLPASAETVGLYLAHLQAKLGRRPSTIRKNLTSINAAHRAAGKAIPGDDPRVRAAMRGIMRQAAIDAAETGEPLVRRAAALTVSQIVEMAAKLPDTVRGARDRAMLLLGATGAFRRSEIARLRVENVTFVDDGLRVHVVRSKTDQLGDGRIVGIVSQSRPEACPVAALRQYLDQAEISDGFLFRSISNALVVTDRRVSDIGVNRAVKRAAKAAGIVVGRGRVSAHSLRASAATIAISKGYRADAVQRLGGWKSIHSMAPYLREGELFGDDNPTRGLLVE